MPTKLRATPSVSPPFPLGSGIFEEAGRLRSRWARETESELGENLRFCPAAVEHFRQVFQDANHGRFREVLAADSTPPEILLTQEATATVGSPLDKLRQNLRGASHTGALGKLLQKEAHLPIDGVTLFAAWCAHYQTPPMIALVAWAMEPTAHETRNPFVSPDALLENCRGLWYSAPFAARLSCA